MDAHDAFIVLGLPPTATVNEVRTAFRRRMLLVHPDRHSGAPESVRLEADRFARECTEAHEIAMAVASAGVDDSGPPTEQPAPTRNAETDFFVATTAEDTAMVLCGDLLAMLRPDARRHGPKIVGVLTSPFSEVSSRRFGDVLVRVEGALLRARDVLAAEEGLQRTTSGVEVPSSWLQPFEMLAEMDDPLAVAVLFDAVLAGD